MRKTIKFLLVLIVVCLCLCFVACNSKDVGGSSIDGEISGSPSSQSYNFVNETESRKLVYTVNINITVADLEKTGGEIVDKVKSCGGWIQNSEEQSNPAYANNYYIVRIPTSRLDEFLSDTESKGEVTNKNITSEDITTVYVTATARKNALNEEKTALNGLTLTTTADILLRSKRISEINAELGALELEINNYNSIIDYSKVTIRLSTIYTPKEDIPFGKKIGNVFKSSIKSVGTVFKALFIVFIAVIPYVAIIGVVIFAIFGIRFLIKKYKPSWIKEKKIRKVRTNKKGNNKEEI